MPAIHTCAMAADRLEGRSDATKRYPTPHDLARDLDPRIVSTPALELLDRNLIDAAEGRCPRLIFSMPPQEGKSQRVSRTFPAWLLSRDPDLRIGIVSYETNTARRWGRAVRNDIRATRTSSGCGCVGTRPARWNGSSTTTKAACTRSVSEAPSPAARSMS